jgi:hypothetical protein
MKCRPTKYKAPSISPLLLKILTDFEMDIHKQMDKITYTPFFGDKTYKSLKALSKRSDIKIVNSDKNLGPVILNTDTYINLIKTHLNDNNTYHKIPFSQEYIIRMVKVNYEKLLDKINLHLNLPLNTKKFIKELNLKLPLFHCLPKLHKGLSNLKSRPIVGAHSWITTNISKFISIELQKYECISVLKDNFSLIPLIEGTDIDTDTFLVTIDITALYTNINIQRLLFILEEKTHEPIFIEIVKFICVNNYFLFNNSVYHQVNGLAMGTNCAPWLANLYLDHTFDEWFRNNEKITKFKRYLDDVFFLYSGVETDLLDDLERINNIIPGIKITYKYSKTNIDFLDLTVIKENNQLIIKSYCKELSKFLYIPPFSHHSPSVIKGFIKSELIRFLRLNTKSSDFHAMKSIFLKRLTDRGYKRSYLFPIFASINAEERAQYDLRRNQEISDETNNDIIFPLILHYSRCHSTKIVESLIPQWNKQIQEAFPYYSTRILIAFKKSPNFLDLVSSNKFIEPQPESIESNDSLPTNNR